MKGFSLDSLWGSTPSRRAGSGRGAGSAAKRSSRAKASAKPRKATSTGPAPKKPTAKPEARRKRTALEVVTEFARKAETLRNDILVGIDPGTKGAVAFKCAGVYCVVDIPRLEAKVRKTRRTTYRERKRTGKKSKTVLATDRTPDFKTIVALFRLFNPMRKRVRVLLEKIPPTIGKRGRKYAEIMLNRAYAMWPLFLHNKGYDFHEEKPSVWKAEFGLLGADKDVSRQRARTLYPEADIARVMDHDRAEALLMVEFLRRKLKK